MVIMLLLLMIYPPLMIIGLIILALVYLLNRRRNTRVVDFSLLKRYRSIDSVRLGRVCLNYGIGDTLARIGEKWVMGMRLSSMDPSTMKNLLRLGQLELSREGIFLLVQGYTVDEVMDSINEALGILRSDGISFTQLKPRDVINVVLSKWLI